MILVKAGDLRRFTQYISFFFLLSLSSIALAQDAAIGGYSPVSYFTKNIAEKGSPEFSVQYEDKTYYLASADQVALFNENPVKYGPRYHYCAYSVVLGTPLPLDPTNFKIVGDTLLLFHVTEESNGKFLWENSNKTNEFLLDVADGNFKLLEF